MLPHLWEEERCLIDSIMSPLWHRLLSLHHAAKKWCTSKLGSIVGVEKVNLLNCVTEEKKRWRWNLMKKIKEKKISTLWDVLLNTQFHCCHNEAFIHTVVGDEENISVNTSTTSSPWRKEQFLNDFSSVGSLQCTATKPCCWERCNPNLFHWPERPGYSSNKRPAAAGQW